MAAEKNGSGGDKKKKKIKKFIGRRDLMESLARAFQFVRSMQKLVIDVRVRSGATPPALGFRGRKKTRNAKFGTVLGFQYLFISFFYKH